MRTTTTSVLALACTLALSACGGSPSGPSGSANLNLRITDSPFSDAGAVLVTLSGVKVHHEVDGWIDVATVPSPLTCDLKKLEGPEDHLGAGSLPAGRYTQIRLVVDSAEIYSGPSSGTDPCADSMTAEGTADDLEIPSGEVKINHPFDLEEGGSTTIVLDFDGDQSVKIHPTGNGRYIMTPVIHVARTTEQ